MKAFPPFQEFERYSLSDIPNRAGFRLTLLSRYGEATGAVVARDDNGCHFVQSLDGHRLTLAAFSSWIVAPVLKGGRQS